MRKLKRPAYSPDDLDRLFEIHLACDPFGDCVNKLEADGRLWQTDYIVGLEMLHQIANGLATSADSVPAWSKLQEAKEAAAQGEFAVVGGLCREAVSLTQRHLAE